VNWLMEGDCLDRMSEIPAGSVDMVMCDLPYGVTACRWDSVIPLPPLWEHYRRVVKPNGAIILTAGQPFTSALVMSNLKMFRYDLVWDKVNRVTGALNANRMPMRRHESVLVFYRSPPVYNPQYQNRAPVSGGQQINSGKHTQAADNYSRSARRFPDRTNPVSIIAIAGAGPDHTGLHPTQKPVELLKYLIKTYTVEGDTVLDNAMGSGSTGMACCATGRRFIGIERDPDYFRIASARINGAECVSAPQAAE
jgi:site-specific DNA-methyltransferase (adenine-specific)